MSDDFIVLVPRDPEFVASPDAQLRVAAILRRLAPTADSITPEVSDTIRFHDAGANFESIYCPRCAAEIDIDWWQGRMDEDFVDGGFHLDGHAAPCCGETFTLNQLTYQSPQAFARTSWTVQNANIGGLPADAVTDLAKAAGVPLVVIHQHI